MHTYLYPLFIIPSGLSLLLLYIGLKVLKRGSKRIKWGEVRLMVIDYFCLMIALALFYIFIFIVAAFIPM